MLMLLYLSTALMRNTGHMLILHETDNRWLTLNVIQTNASSYSTRISPLFQSSSTHSVEQ